MRFERSIILVLLASIFICSVSTAQNSFFLEELTWTEVRDAVAGGKTTVIIPTGGTEQNGPHMVLGKHNYLVRDAAGAIAGSLGDALVAPVLGYVPEGTINPPTGHMWAPGTITLPHKHFVKVVEFAARSFALHGFVDIVLIGDSGGNQEGLAEVAGILNREWSSTPVRVHHVSDYYSPEGVLSWLQTQGLTSEDIGIHAGVTDTSLLMFVHPEGIRSGLRARGKAGDGSGVVGDPTRATAEFGREIRQLKIDAAVRQVRELRVSSRSDR